MKKIALLVVLLLPLKFWAQNILPSSYEGIPKSMKQRIFLDNFDDNRYQWINKTSPSSFKIKDGFFYFKNEFGIPFNDGKPIAFDADGNWEIETRMKFLSGDVEGFNGIMWGELVFGKKYIFSFNSLGYHRLEKIDGFDETDIIAPKRIDGLINKTGDNDIVVRKYGDKYYFFINNNYIGEMPYEGMPGQYIGFSVAPNTMVRINFLRLWKIK